MSTAAGVLGADLLLDLVIARFAASAPDSPPSRYGYDIGTR